MIGGENIGTRKERLFSLFASYKTASLALSLEEIVICEKRQNKVSTSPKLLDPVMPKTSAITASFGSYIQFHRENTHTHTK